MSDPVWTALHLANEITKCTEQLEKSKNPYADLAELRITIGSIRNQIAPCLGKKITEPAFDVCAQSLREILEEIHLQTKNIDPPLMGIQEKTKIYQQDFMLKLRLDQFSALFGSGASRSGSRMISDPQGKSFWAKNFGDKCLMVPWGSFYPIYQEAVGELGPDAEEQLSPFIDFTLDGFVTCFEFHCFLKWFGPMHGSAKRCIDPLVSGVLGGFVPAFEASNLLLSQPKGSFMIRFSKTQPGSFAVTFVDNNEHIRHCLLHHVEPAGLTLRNPPDIFRSLTDFVSKHSERLKFPCGTEIQSKRTNIKKNAHTDPSLTEKLLQTVTPMTEEGKDQQEPKVCTVCMDRPIEVVFLECGHMACCKECSPKMTNCPICRNKIVRCIQVFTP